MYQSIISPHFEFCATILFLCNKSEIKRMQVLQNRAMRIILKCPKLTPTKVMTDMLMWMTIKQRIYFKTILLIYNIQRGLLPDYLQNNLNHLTHKYQTRNKVNYNIKFCRTISAQNQLFAKGLNIYNSLPTNIKEITNYQSFKKNLTNYVKQHF